MIYGLYLSATGVLANSYRQDVIANNLANVETIGFKRDATSFRERLTEARSRGMSPSRYSNPVMEPIGGSLAVEGSVTDFSQGALEQTGQALDVAVEGEGFLAVRQRGQIMLTRDGRLGINQAGNLSLITGGQEVLDDQGRPIPVAGGLPVAVTDEGTVTQGGVAVGRLGVYGVPNPALLKKQGDLLFSYQGQLQAGTGRIRAGMLEDSNVDPATELVAMMDAGRQLEANANMIRCQDETLSRLVNDVGRIG